MHLAAEWIERAKIARAVGVHRYRLIVDLEQPGLCVVRIGRENRGVKWALNSVDHAAAPIGPGLIGQPLRSGKNSAVPDAITNAGHQGSSHAAGNHRSP